MSDLIYIVDDEPSIRRLVTVALRDAGYQTEEFSDGNSLLAAVAHQKPDAIILDWMMPFPDGCEVCRRLRAKEETRKIAVLMLTARSDELDKVVGLEMGADDYLTKPFSVKELASRVRALLRRRDYFTEHPAEVLSAGELVVDFAGHRVKKGGKTVELTPKEFDLLAVLLRNRGRVMSREQLLDQVWEVGYYGDTRTVDVHIRYLRQKIESEPERPQFIETIRGVGYRFRLPEKEEQKA